jgi:hypothetical protein
MPSSSSSRRWAIADAGSCDADGEMRLAGPGAADQHDVALMLEEVAAGKIPDERFVDRSFLEGELVDFLG